MNSTSIIGNVVRDADLRFTKNGNGVASFTVAASRQYIDSRTQEQKEQTAFINCVAWGKFADVAGNYKKGDRVCVIGYLNTRSWETEDGQKKYITEVVAEFTSGFNTNKTESTSNFDAFGMNQQDEIPF